MDDRKEFLNDRPEDPTSVGYPLEDAVLNARQAAAEAWRLLSESMTANQDDLIGAASLRAQQGPGSPLQS